MPGKLMARQDEPNEHLRVCVQRWVGRSRRHWMFPSLKLWAGPLLIVEGEFDAMVANQELGGLIPVVTLGGAQCKPGDTFDAPTLCQFARLFVAADSDEAGQECRDMWSEFSRRSTSVNMPSAVVPPAFTPSLCSA